MGRIDRVQASNDLLHQFSRRLAHPGKCYFGVAQQFEHLRLVERITRITESIDDSGLQLLTAAASKGQQRVEGGFGFFFTQRPVLPKAHILRFNRDAGGIANESVVAAELGPCCINSGWIFSAVKAFKLVS